MHKDFLNNSSVPDTQTAHVMNSMPFPRTFSDGGLVKVWADASSVAKTTCGMVTSGRGPSDLSAMACVIESAQGDLE